MRALTLCLLGLACSAVLSGCGASKTMVMEPPATKNAFTTYIVTEDNSTVPVPNEAKATFVDTLNAEMLKDNAFMPGPGGSGALVLSYRFIQFNGGNQFERWFWGGIGNAGEGSMTVEVRFLDGPPPAGKQLAKIQSDGHISSGVFGGSMADAVKRASKEVANYAKANFK